MPESPFVDDVVNAFSSCHLIPLLTDTDPDFDEGAAYEVAAEIHARRMTRGEQPAGRKIGFTNRGIWPQYNVSAPIWAHIYDTTVIASTDGDAVAPVGHLIQPRVEPEIQLHFARRPPVTTDEEAILDCIDWVALGFEIVQCPFADWRFRAPDAIAAFGVHGLLVIGPQVPVSDIDDCAAKLRRFTVTSSVTANRLRAEPARTRLIVLCSRSDISPTFWRRSPSSSRSMLVRSSVPER